MSKKRKRPKRNRGRPWRDRSVNFGNLRSVDLQAVYAVLSRALGHHAATMIMRRMYGSHARRSRWWLGHRRQ